MTRDLAKTKHPCRSMLYIPGDSPGMLQHAPVFGADSVLLDLEDAVAPTEKDSARRLVSAFLKDFDFGRLVVTVRVNPAASPHFERDLRAVVPHAPHAVRLPKCEQPADIQKADALVTTIEREAGLPAGTVRLHAMLETALGIENAHAVAAASPRVAALTLGGQDLMADMGAQKSRAGRALLYARGRVVTAARAAGIDAFDTVWTDTTDDEGLFEECQLIVELGFSGKAAIHPAQIETIHRAFRPGEKELARSRKIVSAAREAAARGKGVVSVDGRMVDAPVVARAAHVVAMAALYDDYDDEGSVTL